MCGTVLVDGRRHGGVYIRSVCPFSPRQDISSWQQRGFLYRILQYVHKQKIVWNIFLSRSDVVIFIYALLSEEKYCILKVDLDKSKKKLWWKLTLETDTRSEQQRVLAYSHPLTFVILFYLICLCFKHALLVCLIYVQAKTFWVPINWEFVSEQFLLTNQVFQVPPFSAQLERKSVPCANFSRHQANHPFN